jgi:hypothetical protein
LQLDTRSFFLRSFLEIMATSAGVADLGEESTLLLTAIRTAVNL